MNKELQELDKLFKENKWNQVVKKTKILINSEKVIAPYYNLLGLSLSKLNKNQDAENFFIKGINKFIHHISENSICIGPLATFHIIKIVNILQ